MFSVRNNPRLKGILVITVSIVAFLSLFTIAFQWYFNPARLPEKPRREVIKDWLPNSEKANKEIIASLLSNLDDNDAAKYYLMACQSAVKFYKAHPVWDRLYDIADKGWQGDDPELERLVELNTPALDLVREGTSQQFCSMPDEGPLDSHAYLGCFRYLGRLFIAEAGLLEGEGDWDGARKTYADVLRFTNDVYNNGKIIHALNSRGIESLVHRAIGSYLQRLDDEEVCARLLTNLMDIYESKTSLRTVLENDFSGIRRGTERTGEEILYSTDISEDPVIGEYVLDTAKRVWGYVHYRLTWPWVLWQMNRLEETFLAAAEKPYPEIFDGRLKQKFPRGTLSKMLSPSLVKAMMNLAGNDVDRRANIIKVALHLHLLKYGEYPEAIEELAWAVPEDILIDPFSVKQFLYRRTDEGFLFYSVGSNLSDDGGVDKGYPYSEGDIVFQLPEPVDEEE